MDLFRNMNRVLYYIEENLMNDIDFREVVRLVFCFEYYFKRMFFFFVGIILLEYICWRWFIFVVFEFKDSNIKVIDVVIKYNYSLLDLFIRVF